MCTSSILSTASFQELVLETIINVLSLSSGLRVGLQVVHDIANSIANLLLGSLVRLATLVAGRRHSFDGFDGTVEEGSKTILTA